MLNHPNQSDRNIHIAVFFTLFALATTAPVWAGKTTHLTQKPVAVPSVVKKLPRLVGKATVVITVNKPPITMEVDGTNAKVLIYLRIYQKLGFKAPSLQDGFSYF